MLTRLKISGFKNLVDVDVRFGPFTCIAGANASGKSNLFDAIRFLSLLADHPLMEAAGMIRNESDRTADVRSLFYAAGDEVGDKISFEAEMVFPPEGLDELGQQVVASTNIVRYSLTLRLISESRARRQIEILEEQLLPIKKHEIAEVLSFPRSDIWDRSLLQFEGMRGINHKGQVIREQFITTNSKKPARIAIYIENTDTVMRTADAEKLTATMLSIANGTQNPTAFLVRQELRSWQQIFLEPSALRTPDKLTDPAHVAANGRHLASTLFHIATHYGDDEWLQGNLEAPDQAALYASITNRLNELIGEVRAITVDVNEELQQLNLVVTNRQGMKLSLRALSDGTLRFLALAIMLEDYQPGVLCIEEPENGLHPQRIRALLRLLQAIAVDAGRPIDTFDNPLRQVIITTHSPIIVSEVSPDALIFIKTAHRGRGHQRGSIAIFQCLSDTWRAKIDSTPSRTIALGNLLPYLNPIPIPQEAVTREKSPRRVIERSDIVEILSSPERKQEEA